MEVVMATHFSVFRSTILAAVAAAAAAISAPAAADDALGAAEGSGLRAPSEAPWPRWQGRLGVVTAAPAPGARHEPGDDGTALQHQSLSLLGDYYFTQQGLAPQSSYGGGFRATGGLLLGNRAMPWSAPPSGLGGFSIERRQQGYWNVNAPGDGTDTGGVPYVGVGYTGLRSLRATGGGWAFNADVGVMALQPNSAFRLGQQALSDTLRDLQFSPLLQVGVSYKF
jgi:opacity protein-like surface antigen